MRILISYITICFFGLGFIFDIQAQQTIKEGAQLEKLTSNINSPAYEGHPVISPDGKTLFFSREKFSQNIGGVKGGLDIWMSEADSLGGWGPAKNIGNPLNNAGDNYISSVLPDGQTVLLPNLYNSNGSNSSENGLSISRQTSQGWTSPNKVSIDYYTNKSESGDFFLSNDGKILLMSIEYFSTLGNEDLHVSFLKEDRSWSQPVNLGKDINTKMHDLSPCLASDGITLYFSSNGHGGLGSKDIFVSRRLDDTWKKWSKPVNLGPTINTAGMETSFVIPASGKYAYLVSSKNSDTHSEIFRVLIPEKVRPEAVVLMSGKVFNSKTKQPIEAKIKYEILSEGKNLGIATSDPTSGAYTIILPGGGKNYAFYAESAGYLSTNENLDVAEVTEYTELKKDLYLTPIEIGQAITLKNVFFERSKSSIMEESYPELDRLVKVLKDNPSVEIEINGHTDNQGKAELNVQLSEERVAKVKEYIASKGIEPARIKGKGFGGSKPIAPNDTEINRKLNRRVEFKILKK